MTDDPRLKVLDAIYGRLAALERAIDPTASTLKFADGLAERIAALEARPVFTEEMRTLLRGVALIWEQTGVHDGDVDTILRERRGIVAAAFPSEPAAPVWPEGCALDQWACTGNGMCKDHQPSNCPHAGRRGG